MGWGLPGPPHMMQPVKVERAVLSRNVLECRDQNVSSNGKSYRHCFELKGTLLGLDTLALMKGRAP